MRGLSTVGNYLWAESDGSSALVTSMLKDCERYSEEEEIRNAWVAAGRERSNWNVRTPIWLSYHLRTTLHRNDSLGMAASIESRFPFFDEQVI